MAKIHVKNNGGNRFGGVPYGNMAVEHYRIVAKENGAILGADAYEPPKANDVLVLGVLEQGFRLDDAQIIVKTAMSSGITADVGFVYADGADDAKVPQDAAYFVLVMVLCFMLAKCFSLFFWSIFYFSSRFFCWRSKRRFNMM